MNLYQTIVNPGQSPFPFLLAKNNDKNKAFKGVPFRDSLGLATMSHPESVLAPLYTI